MRPAMPSGITWSTCSRTVPAPVAVTDTGAPRRAPSNSSPPDNLTSPSAAEEILHRTWLPGQRLGARAQLAACHALPVALPFSATRIFSRDMSDTQAALAANVVVQIDRTARLLSCDRRGPMSVGAGALRSQDRRRWTDYWTKSA